MDAETSVPNERPYSQPVNMLLSRGDPGRAAQWPDYLAMGLGPEQIPELIRMATDESLNNAPTESPEVWAPLHAWRTLGQMRAEAAVKPLLGLFQRADEQYDDWVLDDLPRAFGEIGSPALEALSAYLAEQNRAFGPRVAAAQSIREIGRRYVESQDACVAALVQQLGKFAANGAPLNGSLVSLLLDMRGVEAAPVIEHAFAAGQVDETVSGDWEDVQIQLGLKNKRDTPARVASPFGFRNLSRSGETASTLKSSPFPDLKAIYKAQKKARSEAKKAKWARQLQRQRRK